METKIVTVVKAHEMCPNPEDYTIFMPKNFNYESERKKTPTTTTAHIY